MTIHFRESDGMKSASMPRTEREKIGSGGFLYRTYGKRAFDILFVIAVAPVGITIVLLSALLIMLGGWSPFYTQLRVGRDGRIFRMVKIRTMVADAESALETYLAQNPEARVEWEKKQKLSNDPRTTRLGVILRKTSLDELPQLLNVLAGDMSIVGPRPMMVDQRTLYPGQAYYELRPGITGPWQVSDRHNSDFADRAVFDAEYNAELGLGTDLRILARTVGVVLRCTGR